MGKVYDIKPWADQDKKREKASRESQDARRHDHLPPEGISRGETETILEGGKPPERDQTRAARKRNRRPT